MPSLLEFSKTRVTAKPPHVIVWPPGAVVAVIGGHIDRELPPGQVKATGPVGSSCWQRLPDGSIEATYQDQTELDLALTITQWIREPAPAAVRQPQQGQLFAMENKTHYSEGL